MTTIREVLEGYKAANEWELEEARRYLPRLTVEESLRQFLELSRFVRQVAPEAEELFLERRMAHWIEVSDKLRRAAVRMSRGSKD